MLELAEFGKNVREIIFFDPATCVTHLGNQYFGLPIVPEFDLDPTMLGLLYGILDQVDEDLAEPSHVGEEHR